MSKSIVELYYNAILPFGGELRPMFSLHNYGKLFDEVYSLVDGKYRRTIVAKPIPPING